MQALRLFAVFLHACTPPPRWARTRPTLRAWRATRSASRWIGWRATWPMRTWLPGGPHPETKLKLRLLSGNKNPRCRDLQGSHRAAPGFERERQRRQQWESASATYAYPNHRRAVRIASATKSRTSSGGSRIGAGSQHAMIAARTPSCPPSQSPQHAATGSDQ